MPRFDLQYSQIKCCSQVLSAQVNSDSTGDKVSLDSRDDNVTDKEEKTKKKFYPTGLS